MAILNGFPPEPKLGNKDYQEDPLATNEQTIEQTMYKPFVAPKGESEGNNSQPKKPAEDTNIDNLEEPNNIDSQGENIEGMKKLYEDPDFPILKNMKHKELITTEELDDIFAAFNKIGDLVEAVKTIGDKDKVKNILDVLKYAKREDAKKRNKITFKKDFKEQIGDTDKRSDKDLSILDLLGENYLVVFPREGGNIKDKTIDLNAAFDRTINSYINGKSIKRNENFDLLLNDIKNPDNTFKDRFDALKDIIISIDTQQGKEGKASKLLHKNIKNGENLENKSLQERFNDLQERSKIAITEKNIEELKKIKIEVSDMKEEADKEGDIFIVSDLDKINGEIDSALKETT